MSELFRLIQWHLDRYGVKEAAFAKKIGVGKNTVNNWKRRGDTLPNPDALRAIAEQVGVPYLIVLDAALLDAGYRTTLVDDIDALKTRIARYVRATQNGVGDLERYLERRFMPADHDITQLEAEMTTAELDRLIDNLIADAERTKYGTNEVFDRELLHQYLGDKLTELERLSADNTEAVVPDQLGASASEAAKLEIDRANHHRKQA